MTHLQYADDIVILTGCADVSIVNMKFLLYYFEWISDQKINYYKSEVTVFGVEEDREWEIANMLNCKVRKMLMKYLGFPIHYKNLSARSFSVIVEKMRNKLQSWKGKNLSYGGRLVLTNSSLSSIPIYTKGVYLLMNKFTIRWIR